MQVRSVKMCDKESLSRIAIDILEPLYGDQSKALTGWLYGSFYKKAFVITTEDDEVAGLLSLKIDPRKEVVKISTLLILEPYQGNGTGRQLLDFALDCIQSETDKKYVFVTVSEEKQESLLFFQKHGFKVTKTLHGKYKDNTDEYVLEKEL